MWIAGRLWWGVLWYHHFRLIEEERRRRFPGFLFELRHVSKVISSSNRWCFIILLIVNRNLKRNLVVPIHQVLLFGITLSAISFFKGEQCSLEAHERLIVFFVFLLSRWVYPDQPCRHSFACKREYAYRGFPQWLFLLRPKRFYEWKPRTCGALWTCRRSFGDCTTYPQSESKE